MSKKYIELNEVYAAIEKCERDHQMPTQPHDYYNDILHAVEQVPAADVVEVVRCKDCKWLLSDGKCPLRTYWTHTYDDYCNYGERKDG